jgi:hypothetical protein
MRLSEYEQVRANSTHFLHVPGHEARDAGFARVVALRGSYVVVEKLGDAAEIVAELDSRGGVSS